MSELLLPPTFVRLPTNPSPLLGQALGPALRSGISRRSWNLLPTSESSNSPAFICRQQSLPSLDVAASRDLFCLSESNSRPSTYGSLIAGEPHFSQPRRHLFGMGESGSDATLARTHQEERVIGYSPEQLYDVVVGVDMYQDFVPWCQRSTVVRRTASEMDAELEVGFKFFREKYMSHVHMERPKLVKTTVSQSFLFNYLDNIWEFRPGPVPNSCTLRFSVAFQFTSSLYRGAADLFFDQVVAQMISSFESQCLLVYGPAHSLVPTVAKRRHTRSQKSN